MMKVNFCVKIRKFVLILSLLLFTFRCSSTVEFLPEPNFRSDYPNYAKKSFQEIEILYHKPQRPFIICGQILVRDFQDGDLEKSKKLLQQESFERKLDGVWILNSKREEIPPTIIVSKNQNGMILSYQELGKEVAKIQGLGFRYK